MRVWAVLLWLCLCAPAAAQNVAVATTGTFPPYLFEEGDQFSGFDVDLMDEICRMNGYTCSYRAYPVRPGFEAVQLGEADVAIGGIGISAAREIYGFFTCPYRQGGAADVPVFALDASVDPQTARIAVLADSLSHQALIDGGYTAVPYETLIGAVSSVLAGETDAFYGNSDGLDLVDGAAEKMTLIGSISRQGSGVAFLVSAERPRLLAAINDSFAILHRNGGLQEIADRWFGPGQFVAPPDIGVACGMVMSAN